MVSRRKEIASAVSEEIQSRHWSTREIILTLLGGVVAVVVVALAIANRDKITDTSVIANYGLLSMFVLAFLAASPLSITMVPVPYWIVTLVLPGMLEAKYGIMSPVFVGLTSAVGSIAGQFITFMVGYGGGGLSRKLSARFNSGLYVKATDWIKRWGSWTVFFMSVTANPLHLPMTVAVATMKYPPHKYLFFGLLGGSIRSVAVAFIGYFGIVSLLNIGGVGEMFVRVLIVFAGVILLTVVWQLTVWMFEIRDKNRKYRAALAAAKKAGKQLLVIGGPWGVQPLRRIFNKPAHGGGDVCLDVDRRAVEGVTCPVVASGTNIPFADKTFGAVFLSHVLEHMPTIEEARQTLGEMNRVADSVFIVYPSRQSIAAWIIREHHVWVWQKNGNTYLEQRGKKRHGEKIVVEATH
ncbi:MAG: VTT domain-containing protein [Dehalococcoidia bacterium]|nr:VTT domain-containing protein [Dehalococcoidia bacterium]